MSGQGELPLASAAGSRRNRDRAVAKVAGHSSWFMERGLDAVGGMQT